VPYIGQDLQVAFPSYTNIDDISGSFDGVTTSFPLTVGGVAPSPAPLGSNQCLISVDGVVQRPDDTGTEGFRLSGGNIIFSSAPSIADDFFGIILAGADYVNVGANFPDGTLGAPSITFDQDNDTGYYRSGSGSVSFASNGVAAGTWSSAGVTAPALIPTGSSVPANGVYLPAANNVAISTNGSERLRIDSSGQVGLGTSTPSSYYSGADNLVVANTSGNAGITVATATTGTGRLYFADGTSGADEYRGWIEYDHTADRLTLGSNGATALAVDSSQRVGIGTTAVDTTLHIQGANTSGRGQLYIQSTSGNFPRFILADSADTMYLDVYGDTSNQEVIRNTGSGGKHVWQINSSEAARIDSSGRLLVGTSSNNSSFNAAVQIAGSSSASTQLMTRFDNNAGAPNLYFAKSRGASVGTNTVVQSGDNIGVLGFYGADGTGYINTAEIRVDIDGTPGTNDMPGRLVFSTTADGASSPTERMRITSGGFLKVSNSGSYIDGTGTYNEIASNQQSSAALILRASNASLDATVGVLRISCTRNTTNDSYYPIVYFNEGGAATRFLVADDGDCRNANNSYGGISDIKLKENIVDAASQWNDLKTLKIRKYNFKQETGQPTHTQIGLIAQEAELVSPGLVSESPDRDAEGNDLGTVTKSVNYSVLYMKAVKALQEAMERIEQLETEMAEVKAQLQAL
jgi:hypothetical protein